MTTHEWLGGANPQDHLNPISFKSDGNFDELKNNHGGKWSVLVRNNSIPTLKMEWTRGKIGSATFGFI